MTQLVDVKLDARGLSCPMPLLKAKLVLNGMPPGGVLQVKATDAGSWDDFVAFVQRSPHQLLVREQRNDEYHYLIRKGE